MQTVITNCTLCPRKCGVNRTVGKGMCGGGSIPKAARSALHHWEEPCISGAKGSGTIFFSGCPLNCIFCQNHIISHENYGKELSVEELCRCMLDLQSRGAHNISFVTGTHYVPWIVSAVERVKDNLTIPVVWNTSGYERVETLKMLDGIADIYMPDFKYLYSETAEKYSHGRNYPEIAEKAILEMYRQTGKPVFDEKGVMKRGLIIRHLVLPGHRHESMAILERLTELLPKEGFILSLMGQYTPPKNVLPYKNLNRRLTTMEYQSVLKRAEELGLQGYSQELSSASSEYTPSFNLEGLEHDC